MSREQTDTLACAIAALKSGREHPSSETLWYVAIPTKHADTILAALAPTVSGGEGWEELERLAKAAEADNDNPCIFAATQSLAAFNEAANPQAVLALIAVARGGGALPPAAPSSVSGGGKLESGDVLQGPVQQVAVRFGDTTVTAPMPGFRHHHILTVASFFGHRHGEQGFATADGSFLTRKEAAQIALKSGQVTKLIAPPDLYSEDCW